MNAFDIRKQEMLTALARVRNDCEVLIERTYAFREDLLKVNTKEEAEEFDRTHDLEEGLMYIRLYD